MNSPVPDPPMINAEAAAKTLCEMFLTNADHGDNAANDHLIAEILDHIRTRWRDADSTPTHRAGFPLFHPMAGDTHDEGADHE